MAQEVNRRMINSDEYTTNEERISIFDKLMRSYKGQDTTKEREKRLWNQE